MSPDPTRPVKTATKATTKPAKEAANKAKPSQLAKRLPLSVWTKIRLAFAWLRAKLKKWRLRRRARIS